LILLFFLSFNAAGKTDISAACGSLMAVVVSGDVFPAESGPLSRPRLPAGFRQYGRLGRSGLDFRRLRACRSLWTRRRRQRHAVPAPSTIIGIVASGIAAARTTGKAMVIAGGRFRL